MEQYGRVVAVGKGTATLEVVRHSSCEKCGACGIGTQGTRKVEAKNGLGAKVGDIVKFSTPDRDVLTAAAIVYLIPIGIMIIGIVIGQYVSKLLGYGGSNQLFPAFFGLAFLVFGFFGVNLYDRRVSKDRYRPEIVEILGNDDI